MSEKLLVWEALWEDVRERCEERTEFEALFRLLEARRERVRRGEESLLDWDEVEGLIGRV